MNINVKNLAPYSVAQSTAWDSKHQPLKGIVKADWNEGSNVLPSFLRMKSIEFVTELIENGLNYYPEVHNEELIFELSKYTLVEASNLQYFAGSDHAHECIARALLQSGDTVLIIAPTYDNFRVNVDAIGCNVIYLDLDEDFSLSIQALDFHLASRSPKMVYLCSPNNPNGLSYHSPELEALIRKNTNTYFLLDEAYFEFGKSTFAHLLLPNVLTTRTFSKAFCLAGIRLGYLIANREVIYTVNKVRNPKSISQLSQFIGIQALKNSEYMYAFVKEIEDSRNFVQSFFNLHGFKCYPSNANFVLVEVDTERKILITNRLANNKIYVREFKHHRLLLNKLRITLTSMRDAELIVRQFNM